MPRNDDDKGAPLLEIGSDDQSGVLNPEQTGELEAEVAFFPDVRYST